ncbi:MAG TPA: YsnF/AvaK domain-containing protein [Thermomicrobiales bacterium]|jgi:uncharacterized protein (TIGR02271 family)
MSQYADHASIMPGMPVFDAMGASLGPVEAIDTATLRVRGQDVPVNLIARVDTTGVHLHLASAGDVTTRAEATRAEDGRMVIPLVEERLAVATRETDLGEIILRKRVIEEERMIPVVFRREEVQIVRREPGQPLPPEALGTGGAEVTRIPIHAWEPVISKQTFVSREVVVDKGRVAEERQVTGMVRRQQVSVEARYADARQELEQHFVAGQSATGGAGGPQTFADAEPHYRTGFVAGSEPQHGDRDFAAVEPQIRASYGADAEQTGDGWAQLRDKIQAGFEAARRRT